MRSALAVIAAAALSLGTLPSANAAVFHEPSTDLELDLTIPDAAICYLKPRALQTERAGCEGLDVAAAVATIPNETRLTAIIRFADWGYAVNGSWQTKPAPGPMSREDGRRFVRGAQTNAGAFKPAKKEPDFLMVNGVQVLRFTMVSASTAILTYVVVGKDSLVSMAFLTDFRHLARVEESAEKTMATLKMAPEAMPASWPDSRAGSHSYQVGYHATKALMGLLTLAAICIGAVLVYRTTRR